MSVISSAAKASRITFNENKFKKYLPDLKEALFQKSSSNNSFMVNLNHLLSSCSYDPLPETMLKDVVSSSLHPRALESAKSVRDAYSAFARALYSGEEGNIRAKMGNLHREGVLFYQQKALASVFSTQEEENRFFRIVESGGI